MEYGITQINEGVCKLLENNGLLGVTDGNNHIKVSHSDLFKVKEVEKDGKKSKEYIKDDNRIISYIKGRFVVVYKETGKPIRQIEETTISDLIKSDNLTPLEEQENTILEVNEMPIHNKLLTTEQIEDELNKSRGLFY
jgi:hypothetical protein